MIDIAVLGANGFVGSAICVELEKKKKNSQKLQEIIIRNLKVKNLV
jgi:nucleoside-diphosphate-sugar epimerase